MVLSLYMCSFIHHHTHSILLYLEINSSLLSIYCSTFFDFFQNFFHFLSASPKSPRKQAFLPSAPKVQTKSPKMIIPGFPFPFAWKQQNRMSVDFIISRKRLSCKMKIDFHALAKAAGKIPSNILNLPIHRLHPVLLQKSIGGAKMLTAKKTAESGKRTWMRRFQNQVFGIGQHRYFTLRRFAP